MTTEEPILSINFSPASFFDLRAGLLRLLEDIDDVDALRVSVVPRRVELIQQINALRVRLDEYITEHKLNIQDTYYPDESDCDNSEPLDNQCRGSLAINPNEARLLTSGLMSLSTYMTLRMPMFTTDVGRYAGSLYGLQVAYSKIIRATKEAGLRITDEFRASMALLRTMELMGASADPMSGGMPTGFPVMASRQRPSDN